MVVVVGGVRATTGERERETRRGRRGRSSGVNMHHCGRLTFDQTNRSVQPLNLQREQVRASREKGMLANRK